MLTIVLLTWKRATLIAPLRSPVAEMQRKVEIAETRERVFEMRTKALEDELGTLQSQARCARPQLHRFGRKSRKARFAASGALGRARLRFSSKVGDGDGDADHARCAARLAAWLRGARALCLTRATIG
jgi:hypothetical protein